MPQWGRFLVARPNVDLVTINADFVPDSAEVADAVLAESELTQAQNFIFGDEMVERLRYEIDPN